VQQGKLGKTNALFNGAGGFQPVGFHKQEPSF
jgi:hypothetical protein